MYQIRQYLNMSCPSGGTFSVCEKKSHFIGCCESTNPCDPGCSAGQLQNTSFNASLIGSIPDQQCNRGASFYMCATTNPPFWGCCKSNPCQTDNGCPASDLAPALLSAEASQYAVYLLPNMTTSINDTSASSTSATGSKLGKGLHLDRGAIIGLTLGLIVFTIAVSLGAITWCYKRHTKKKRKELNLRQSPVTPYIVDLSREKELGNSWEQTCRLAPQIG